MNDHYDLRKFDDDLMLNKVVSSGWQIFRRGTEVGASR